MNLPSELMHPELMVIGDSLAQGCRSLSVTRTFCSQSWGARLAQMQGWKFNTPDLPRPILFDLEFEIRNLGNLINIAPGEIAFGGFVTRLMQNLRAWLANRKESEFICFDNLGLAGAKISDLYERSASSCDQDIAAKFPNGASGPIHLTFDEIGALHIDINGRFTLNPSQDPSFAGFTPLEWVRQRLPKVLVVQIGHNHGLYSIGSDAENVPFDQNDQDGATFLESIQHLGRELGQLPPDVKTIIYLLLPKVGAVANLKPQSTTRTNGYAESYEPVFSVSKSTLTGNQLADIDLRIKQLNAQIVNALRAAVPAEVDPNRLKFIDTFSFFEGYDYKNSLDTSKRIIISDSVAVDNFYVTGKLSGFPPLKSLAKGGFQNVDGMHPSGCGYALLASRVSQQCGFPNAPSADWLSDAFQDDQLLSNFPLKLNAIVLLLEQLRSALIAQEVAFAPTGIISEAYTDLHLVDALQMMKNAVLK